MTYEELMQRPDAKQNVLTFVAQQGQISGIIPPEAAIAKFNFSPVADAPCAVYVRLTMLSSNLSVGVELDIEEME